MARFDNTLNGYVSAKKYLVERNIPIDDVDDYALIRLANKTVKDLKFPFTCEVRGVLRRPNSITTCDNSVTSDPTKCAASPGHKCMYKHKVK